MDIDWVEIMDVAIATIIGALVAVAGSIIVNWLGNRKGYKDIDAKIGNPNNKTLVGLIEQKTGKLDDTSLSDQHKHIESYIKQIAGNLSNTTLSGQNIAISKEILKLQDSMESDRKVESLKRQQLTGDQARIDQSIASLAAFSHVMIDLQNENTELKQEIKELKIENQQLIEKLEQSEDLSEDQVMKMINS